jgi:hypothetical protein
MKEALQRALDALGPTPPECCGCQVEWQIAITAIKEALANEALDKMAENARELGLDYEPEQEPVGEIVDAIEGAFKCSFTKMLPVGTKLYTTPPQRTWVGLTDKEIEEIWKIAMFTDYGIGAELSNQPFVHYAKAIEAKLKDKNI